MPKPESLTAQSAALTAGRMTSRQLVETALETEKHAKNLNAFVSLAAEAVLSQADASDARRRAGQTLGPLDGVPVAIKDNYLTRDFPTTACSGALPLEPTGQDAALVARLRAAGVVIFGKTNMHEWAYGATNETSNFGPTRNPHDPARITGGSSGGSAAAVAAGIVGAAMGSDTGGSIRIPAAACGIYGFKPGYGRASRRGVLPLAWSLDAPGPLAASLEDIEMLLPLFFGPDKGDRATHGARAFCKAPPLAAKLRLLHLTGPGLERHSSIDAAIRGALSRSQAHIAEAGVPGVRRAFGAWEVILHAEATAYHRDLLALRPEGFSPVMRAHLEAGRVLSAQDLLLAQQVRTAFCHTLDQGIGPWDAIVLPTLPVSVPRHGDDWQSFGSRKEMTQDAMTWFCWIANLAGLPAVTLPIGRCPDGLPIGLMLMGRAGGDEALLALAQMVDRALTLDGANRAA